MIVRFFSIALLGLVASPSVGGAAPKRPRGPYIYKNRSVMSGHHDPFAVGVRWALTNKRGYYDMIIHGNPRAIAMRLEGPQQPGGHRFVYVGVDKLGKFARATGYRGGKVRFVSCDVGALPDGPAQKLADLLGVEVIAPTKNVWTDGSVGTRTPDGSWEPGAWRTFLPGKKQAPSTNQLGLMSPGFVRAIEMSPLSPPPSKTAIEMPRLPERRR